MPPYELLIVNDLLKPPESLRDIFESTQDFLIIGFAANGQETVSMVRQSPPGIILMDLVMPVMNGVEAILHLANVSPQTKVIIQTAHAEHPRLFALQFGDTLRKVQVVKRS